ncbi:hypothetical protein J8995_14860 [Klebsiella quasipneumoniae subsp. quasipneumoniae]|uniref:hypothetical protein n=1 Tax=Klebsiella quasipneumoniae TaxID=1463165 RepID=UPI001CA77B13|nr:hypothetical protein [Klebsiella quasipneumoniae]UAA05218.1 hypothetical protein KZ661_02395 [Klebsiella quasipneumoniae]UPS72177.1 hypothetical protein M0M92_23230 [Klebsiella quasipneumoniae]
MKLTSRKKTILSYFEQDNRAWVTGEIGAPPLDVSSAEYLLYGTGINDNRHWIESTRRTLEAMGKDGLLEGYRNREARSIVMGGETIATVVRYGIPGTVSVVRDMEGAANAIAGECVRLY